MDIPRVASRDEWLAARKDLLAQEKQASHAKDVLDAARRALPMIEIDKEYSFAGPEGQAGLCGPGRRANRRAAARHAAMSAGMAAMLLAML